MNAIAATVLAVLACFVMFASRRIAVLALICGVLYLTQQQSVDVFNVNITGIRLLGLIGFLRATLRGEFKGLERNSIDSVLVLLYAFTTVVFILRSDVRQAEMIGTATDALLCYFTFRALIRDFDEMEWFLRAFVILLVPYVALLSIEMVTHENPFRIFGATIREMRGDRPRVLGSFRNPSLLGTLGAAFLPLYIAMAWKSTQRSRAIAGIALCTAIVYISNSGSPVMAVMVAFCGWLCWSVRERMYLVRAGLVAMLVMLALVMKAPVWFLLDRVSGLSGGGGWHRAHLIDMAVRDFDLWWFAGTDLEKTRPWFPYILDITGAADITNNFLMFGINAGLLAMLLLILLLGVTFRRLGVALSAARARDDSKEAELMLWGLGCAVVVHIATWFSITYFDQFYVIWFMQLAVASTLSNLRFATLPERSRQSLSSRTPNSKPVGMPSLTTMQKNQKRAQTGV